ncbi:MAG: DNA polymerase/3'-5' exonuclease PolX [Chitinophagales bacterium]|nr:DNA polymerase/3'-5' exonuclease PolX [Chitinophagales bacterium]
MDNYTIAEHFSLLSKLMDIHGENSFKSRTYSAAAFNIEKLPVQLQDVDRSQLFTLKGIGDSVGRKVIELLDTGELSALKELVETTPAGVIELLQIKGLGPKKIHIIWKEMGIESVGELLYACTENRLTRYKGFGEKTQRNVQEAIEFFQHHQGHFLYSQVFEVYDQVNGYLQKLFAPHLVAVTGAYRRQDPVIEELAFVVDQSNEWIKPKFQTAHPPELLEETTDTLLYKLQNGLKLRLHTGKGAFAERLFRSSGSAEFIEAFTQKFPNALNGDTSVNNDQPLFEKVGLPYIPPAVREKSRIIEKAANGQLPQLIQVGDIKSLIHSHSNWSDGSNTIEEMAKECIRRGWEYMVISDHSKAAAYANGLTEDRIRQQHKQIFELNQQLAPFKIFKSIECDILNDGSMDYTDEILASFDLVIASVHSNLSMSEEKAMNRLLKAISNPYVSILGHMTGRLLLSRNGYPVDHTIIIEACIKNQVAIEINAHPRRLDMDWKWIDYALEKGALLSINPDAHALDGFDDVRFGVLAAQKGGLTKEKNLSSFTLSQFEKYLEGIRNKK